MYIAWDYMKFVFLILFVIWIITQIVIFKKANKAIDYIWLVINLFFPLIGFIVYKVYCKIWYE